MSAAIADMQIGLEGAARADVAAALVPVLAESYALMAKTHGFHWNVKGPQFPQLHELFQGFYEELFAAVDELAERIRALGANAPGSLGQFSQHSSLPEINSDPDAKMMVQMLLADNEALARRCREAGEVAQAAGDTASEDLMIERTAAHDKTAWMLRATLDD